MKGYDPTFLQGDIELPLPTFSPWLDGQVLRGTRLRDGVYADYVHYSVVTNMRRRAPLFTAMNIDRSKLRTVDGDEGWSVDSRIGAEHQLNNDYYRSNPWDRGHMARRETVAWGETDREATRASGESFYYSNASLQHRNFNRDEWVALEDWVKDLSAAANERITVFTGPVYGAFNRSIEPEGRAAAMIPAGFFKVVAYKAADGKVDVRSFLVYQDRDAVADTSGRHLFNWQRYQATVAEIEHLTGLVFPEAVYDRNPLLFHEDEEAARRLGISHFPERIEVDDPAEMRATDSTRDYVADDDVPVFIAAAMVNPEGNDRAGEWVSVLNLTGDEIDLAGWTLSDAGRAPLRLDGKVAPGHTRVVGPVAPVTLSNEGGVIILKNDDGKRLDRVKYREHEVTAGVPVRFAHHEETTWRATNRAVPT